MRALGPAGVNRTSSHRAAPIGRMARRRRPASLPDRDQGAVLPLVLVMILIGAMIVVPILAYTSSVLSANRVEAERARNVEAAKGAIRTALDDPGLLFTGCPANASDLLLYGAVESVSVGIACDPLDELSAEEVFGLTVPIGAAKLQVGPGAPGFDPWVNGDYGESVDYETVSGQVVPDYIEDANKWWTDYDFQGTVIDPTVPVSPQEIWVPSLPTYSNVERDPTPLPMPAAFDCSVFLPGHYPNGLDITSGGNYYFASGVYYFEDEVAIRGGANVVVGQGLADFGLGNDCADDIQVGANVTVPPGTVYAIDGNTGGATWIFGDAGRLTIDDTGGAPNVRFNQRYAEAERGGWINIMSVNGDWSYNADTTDDDEFEDVSGDHSVTNVNWVPRSTVRSGDNTLTLDEAAGSYVPSHPMFTDEARVPNAPATVTGIALTREVAGPDDGAIVVSVAGVEGSSTNGAIIDDYEVGIAGTASADPVVTCSISAGTLYPTTEQPAGSDPWGRSQASAIGENASNPDGYACLIDTLTENQTYYVAARSHNEAGWSEWSSRALVNVPTGAPPAGGPGIFGNIEFRGYGTDGALVSWDPSIDASQAPVQEYEVTVYRVTDISLSSMTPKGDELGLLPATINGNGFLGATVTDVTFDGLSADSFSVASNKIDVDPPAHAPGDVDVYVVFGDQVAGPLTYKYEPTVLLGPSATSLSSSNGPEAGGGTISILGTGFSGATSVTFGGASIPFTFVDDTEIQVTVPAGTGTAAVSVTNLLGTSTPLAYTYVPPPAAPPLVTSALPGSGPYDGGTTVTINGSGFTDVTDVTFGGVPGTNLVVVSDTQLTVDTPPHPVGDVTVDVVVLSAAGGSVPRDFSYDPPPVPPPAITSMLPSSGSTAGGTQITLRGTNFTGATDVTFGGVSGTSVQVQSDTEIRVTSPAHAAGGANVVVVGPTSSSAPATFTYSANAVTLWPVDCTTVLSSWDCDRMPSCPSGETAVFEYNYWGQVRWSCENACYNGDLPAKRYSSWTCAPSCPSNEQPRYSGWSGSWRCDSISCSWGRTGVYAFGQTFCYYTGGFANSSVHRTVDPSVERYLAMAPPNVDVSEVVASCTARPKLGRGADADLEWTPITECAIDTLPPLGAADEYRVEVKAVNATGVTTVSDTFSGPSGSATLTEVPGRLWYPYTPAPIISIDVNDASTVVDVPGYVAVPMGRFSVDNPNGAPITLSGGVVAGTFSVNDPRPTATFGFEPSVVMQRTIRLVTTVGNITSTAVVKINSDTNYGVSRWVTQ